MTTDRIYLVQGDVNRPQIQATITDENTGSVINITGATVVLKFRLVGSDTLQATITGTVTNGSSGLVVFSMTEEALAGAAGEYEGEIEVTFAAGAGVQTVYDLLKFRVREQF